MKLRYARRLLLEDLVLVAALAFILAVRPFAALALPLAGAIALALLWGFATIHVPSRVELTERGISFSRYGRTHAFAWSDVARIRVRRMLVGDRVLVRIQPSPPWRGRYWVAERFAGYEELVARARVVDRSPPSLT